MSEKNKWNPGAVSKSAREHRGWEAPGRLENLRKEGKLSSQEFSLYPEDERLRELNGRVVLVNAPGVSVREVDIERAPEGHRTLGPGDYVKQHSFNWIHLVAEVETPEQGLTSKLKGLSLCVSGVSGGGVRAVRVGNDRFFNVDVGLGEYLLIFADPEGRGSLTAKKASLQTMKEYGVLKILKK